MTDPADVVWFNGSRHDPDRVGPFPSVGEIARARYNGRYPIDEFGADPQLQDLVNPIADLAVRVRIVDGEHIPASGSAVLVSNRGFGVYEPAVLATAVRRASGRHLRVVGAPALPLVGALTRRLGVIGYNRSDIAACCNLGHLVALPLGRTWLRAGAGSPPIDLLLGALGHRVLPVAIRPGGPFGTGVLPWTVQFGTPIQLDAGDHPVGDPLAAAELADRVRSAVDELLALPH